VNHWRQIAIIARREFVERARSKVFLTTMGFIALLIIGGIALLSLIGTDEEATPLGIAGDSPTDIDRYIEEAALAFELDVTVTALGTSDDAVAAVEAGDVDAALVDGSTIVSNQGASATVTAIFTAAANAAVRADLAAELGLTGEEVAQILTPIDIRVLELDAADPDGIARGIASFLAALVLLTTIMLFGQFVAMGIVEEKQNRVVEVVLARVRTTSLLIGKVLGIGALGLVQISAIALAVVIGLTVVPLPDLGVPGLTTIGITAVAWLAFWFVLGYLVYSFIYAALGATISRQEDLQSVAYIPAFAIMPAYFLVSITSTSGGEVSPLVRAASFVPLWSPIVMPFRINVGSAEWWEVVLAVVIAVATIALLVAFGARVYRGAALRTGAKVSLRDAWRSASD
jgi:ABC-2 type transport system permease protein